ncbi:hypothetical protein PTQ20_15435, partial [Clostridium perfringens]|nr:hypothetical protein [Clostridium perfringens]
TVMVSLLTSTGNRESNTGRMPGSNTGNLTQTLVGLAGQLLGVPPGGDALEPVTLCDSNAIDHLIGSKDRVNWDLLLKMLTGPINLLGDGAAVDLDLH